MALSADTYYAIFNQLMTHTSSASLVFRADNQRSARP